MTPDNQTNVQDARGGQTRRRRRRRPRESSGERQQRTTDITSILKNELSVVKTVDFVSQLFRQELDPYTGRYNITPELLETLKIVIDGLFSRLRQSSDIGPVILSGQLISIEQDEVELDTINVLVDIEVPVPANFIRVRIQV